MSVQTLERLRPRTIEPAPDVSARARRWPLALGGLVCVAALYHWLQSLGHVTPAVFTDELMFSELARSIAGGDGLTVRGEPFPFPAIVPAVAQALAWLLGGGVYEAVKALNAVLMSLAVVPAWFLARIFLRPAHAFAVSVATVATGGMIYHSYLTSEAVAYPVFLVAVWAMVAAIGEPSKRRDAVAVAVMALAVLTRAQFVVLPAVFVVAVLVVGRPVRRHALSLSALSLGALAVLVSGPSVLGFYRGAGELHYSAVETLRWAGWTGGMLPFAAGLLVVPGALLGLALAVLRPRNRAEAAFGVIAPLVVSAGALQAGLIASGEANRPLERYVFYAVPLLFVAFFLYVERGAPHRRACGAVALGLGGLSLAVPFASLALDPFSFDSTTLSAVETLGRWVSVGDAAALFALGGVAAALLAAVAPLRRAGLAIAAASIVLSLAVGVAAYAGDRRMTTRTLAQLAPGQRDWLDRLGVGEADVLVLPGGSLHFGWMLESWNRDVGRTFHLGDVDTDPLPFTEVGILADGTVADTARRPVRTRYLVVNDLATQIELDGERVATPVRGLSLFRTKPPLRLRSLATGVYTDRWARGVATYAVWPAGVTRGTYRVRLQLPAGRLARSVEVEAGRVRKRATLRPGAAVDLRIPASGHPIPELAIRVGRADLLDGKTPRPRLVAARVQILEFTPKTGSRNLGNLPIARTRDPCRTPSPSTRCSSRWWRTTPPICT